MLAKNFGWKQIFISKGNKNKTVSAQIEEMREDNLPEIGERVVLVGGIYKGKTVKIIRYTAVMVRVEFVEKAGIPARSTTIMKSSLPRKKKSPQPTTVQVPTKTSPEELPKDNACGIGGNTIENDVLETAIGLAALSVRDRSEDATDLGRMIGNRISKEIKQQRTLQREKDG